jgi:hypothetical protein
LDITEPTIQDVSSHLDFLALMLIESSFAGDWSDIAEAKNLIIYNAERLTGPVPPTNNDEIELGVNCTGQTVPESDSGQYDVKKTGKFQSYIIHSFDTAKGHVCALTDGQALRSGVGPISPLGRQLIVYLTAKDAQRWELAAAAI